MTANAETETTAQSDRCLKSARIIFINRFYYPDQSATSQMLTDIAVGLAAQGLRISVVASRQLYEDALADLPAREHRTGVEILRTRTTRFGRLNLVGRALDYVSFYLGAAWTLFRLVRRGDVVVVKTDPPLFAIIAAPIIKVRGARLINWLQDIFPEVAELVYPPGSIGTLAYGVLRRMRNATLAAAATNVVLGQRMRARVAGFGVPPEKIDIIPNWADGTLIYPIAPGDNPLRRDWGLENTFTVGYSGNLGRAHEYQAVLDAIEILERADTGSGATGDRGNERAAMTVRWLFIGGGALFREFEDQIKRRQLRSVLFRPYQPRERLAQSLSVADVHLVSLRPDMEGLIVPSKYYGIAAAGRPAIFIGAPDGEIATTVRSTASGLVVPAGNGRELAVAVRALASDATLLRSMSENARRSFEQSFGLDQALHSWLRVLSKSCGAANEQRP